MSFLILGRGARRKGEGGGGAAVFVVRSGEAGDDYDCEFVGTLCW